MATKQKQNSKQRSGTSSSTTVNHEEIRRWVEERGGKPATVKGTGDEVGILRIDFPGYSGGDRLEEISWEEFFDKFEESQLAFLYQEETSGGKQSRFSKLISRNSADISDDELQEAMEQNAESTTTERQTNSLDNLADLLNYKVQLLRGVEELQLEALRSMEQFAQGRELKKCIQQHIRETEAQLNRLDEAYQLLGVERLDVETEGIEGLIAEGEKTLSKDASPEALDAAIIANMQVLEHYEIAVYGTACYMAEELALMPVWQLLSTTLNEEKATDEKLNELAKSKVNVRAEKLQQQS